MGVIPFENHFIHIQHERSLTNLIVQYNFKNMFKTYIYNGIHEEENESKTSGTNGVKEQHLDNILLLEMDYFYN